VAVATGAELVELPPQLSSNAVMTKANTGAISKHLFVHIEHQAMPWRLRHCQGAALENSSSFAPRGSFSTRYNGWRLPRDPQGDSTRNVGPKGERRAPKEGGGSLMPACSWPALRRTSIRLPGGACNRSADTGFKYPRSNNSTTALADYSHAARAPAAAHRYADCVEKEEAGVELRPPGSPASERCVTVLLTYRAAAAAATKVTTLLAKVLTPAPNPA